MEKELRNIEFVLEDDMGNTIGDVDLISLVTEPAIELNTQFFSKKKKELFAQEDSDKQIITGPVMIPNKKILRYDEASGEYFNCWFSEQTVEKAAQLIAKNGGLMKTSLEHQAEKTNKGFFFESWIVTGENDKIYDLGYSQEDVPVGSWCASIKIEDENFWKELKELRKDNPDFGFSIESIFAHSFAAVEDIIEQAIANEPGEEPLVEDIVEENAQGEEKPKNVSKKQLIRNMVEQITQSETIDASDKLNLIEKLVLNS